MSHELYPVEVMAEKFDSQLITNKNLEQYCTIDTSLSGDQAGMKKKIITRGYTGTIDEVAMGQGNTNFIEATWSAEEYEVGTTQGQFKYYDEQQYQDPKLASVCVKGLTESFTNDTTTKIKREFLKGNMFVTFTTISFDNFADAVAMFGEEDTGLFGLVSVNMVAAIRKALKDDLKYVEGFARTGYIGTVCGVPIISSAAIPDDNVIIATKEAVTVFLKKTSEVEYDRDKDKRLNFYIARKIALVALTDATKVVRIAKAGTAPTVTTATKATKIVSGACNGAYRVDVYVNGAFKTTATVTNADTATATYSATLADNLVAADKVKVIAYSYTKAAVASAEFTVAV